MNQTVADAEQFGNVVLNELVAGEVSIHSDLLLHGSTRRDLALDGRAGVRAEDAVRLVHVTRLGGGDDRGRRLLGRGEGPDVRRDAREAHEQEGRDERHEERRGRLESAAPE